MNSLDINGVSLVGNISSISDIKITSNGKKYRYFDICQNSKYRDKFGEEKDSKSFFTIRLFEEQIVKYETFLKKGNWIHVIGRLRNYINKDMEKKFYVSVDTIREMNTKEKVDYFEFDWLNDSESCKKDDSEVDKEI